MKINRRQFVLLTAGLAAGCKAVDDNGKTSAANAGQIFNAGPASNYAADGVYSNFRNEGFFVIRQNGKLFALSAICTHRNCKLTAEPNHSFYCKCHGSTFDPNGHFTQGPARRDLPVLPSFANQKGELIINVPVM
jgi:Rieske Fe-S protein